MKHLVERDSMHQAMSRVVFTYFFPLIDLDWGEERKKDKDK